MRFLCNKFLLFAVCNYPLNDKVNSIEFVPEYNKRVEGGRYED